MRRGRLARDDDDLFTVIGQTARWPSKRAP